MSQVQMPNVAGLFYPDDPEILRQDIERMLAAVPSREHPLPKALIAPHAGYVYSGPIAASAYAQLHPLAPMIRQVVLLAPSHRVAFRGMALPTARFFNTPLGDIAVDADAVAQAATLPAVTYMDRAFEGEHALEVQLPFLQMVLPRFTLVPVVVGEADGDEVAALLELLWGDERTLIVVSSDLSHYLAYDSASRQDRHTTELIEALDGDLAYGDACGRNPIRGLLHSARKHGLKVTTLDLRNSGDTAGDRDRVVGYGAYAFH